mgnify:CR=1 FL=1
MTLTDIAGYLPHGLIGYHHQGAICKIDMAFAAKYGVALCNYRPVLRHMRDLSMEITEKGYNDGKPFVPIIKLVEAATGLQGAKLIGNKGTIQGEYSVWKYEYSLYWDLSRKTFGFYSNVENEHNVEIEGGVYMIWNQTSVLDLLHRWHFDYRGLIEAGEAVSVHELKKDPYQ